MERLQSLNENTVHHKNIIQLEYQRIYAIFVSRRLKTKVTGGPVFEKKKLFTIFETFSQ